MPYVGWLHEATIKVLRARQFLRACIHYRLGGWANTRVGLQRVQSKEASSTTRGRAKRQRGKPTSTEDAQMTFVWVLILPNALDDGYAACCVVGCR